VKTLSLERQAPTLEEVLRLAKDEGILLQSQDGERYFLSRVDEFTAEVELLRKHHDFLAYLDECKNDDTAIPLEDIERQYR
jgi:hypothetical protein